MDITNASMHAIGSTTMGQRSLYFPEIKLQITEKQTNIYNRFQPRFTSTVQESESTPMNAKNFEIKNALTEKITDYAATVKKIEELQKLLAQQEKELLPPLEPYFNKIPFYDSE